MKIELKILDRAFYSRESNGMLLYPLPDYQTEGAAAIDLVATQDYTIYPGEVVAVPTGLAMHIANSSVAALILPRSGLGTKGLVLANTIGLIDSDYQGELIVQAWNRNEQIQYTSGGYPLDKEIKKRHNNKPDEYHKVIYIKAGERFAQLAFVPIIRPSFKVVQEFSNTTKRNTGGFGSTNL